MAKVTKNTIQDITQSLNYGHIALIATFFIVFGATFYHIVEKFSWLNSFYFTVVTLATVGYGDFVPKTTAGKLFTMLYVFFGISIFILLAKIVLTGVAVRANGRKKARSKRN